MAGAIDVLNVARSQIGFVEGNAEETPYAIWYGIPNAPYCAMSVSWCFAQVGLSSLVAAQTPKGFSYCPAGLAWFQRQGCVVGKYAGQPGDLVFYDWNSDGQPDHIEILEAASADGITTIGFNTGNPNDPTNPKTGCYRVHRPYMFVMAVVRPKYPTVVKPVSPTASNSKKATAAVATGATAIAGGTAAIHNQITTPVKPQTVFVAPPFPITPKSFNLGQTNDAVMAVEKALAKAGLLPSQYVTGTMNTQTETALKKWEKSKGISATGIPQIVYDTLKASLP
jgi:CHAP domain/Putative peptidoglycan binding domain